MFEYQPLRVGEDTGKVLLASNDLVLSTYDLVSSPTGPQKHFFFETNLGNSRVVKIKFQNYVRQKSDYIYKVGFCCSQCVNFLFTAQTYCYCAVNVVYMTSYTVGVFDRF